jgi:CRP-like cAMP-binding protein
MSEKGFSMLIENISRHIAIGMDEKNFLEETFSPHILSKRQFLLRVPEVGHHTAFVTSGCLRSYSIDRNGTEHIYQFAPAGWWIADIQSVITGTPGTMNIDAIADSAVLLLHRRDQEILFTRFPQFERFFRIIMEKSLAANSNRLLDYMCMSAQERYFAFLERYPELSATISQKHIAAYIGVTPEFLSKLRADLVKKG